MNKKRYIFILFIMVIVIISFKLVIEFNSEKRASSESFILSAPLSWSVGDELIIIKAAKFDKDGFSINLNGNGGKIPDISEFSILDDNGVAYIFDSGRVSSADGGWEAFLVLNNSDFALQSKITLQKGSEKIDVQMQNFNSIDIDELTSFCNGIYIKAIVSRDNDRIKISLIHVSNDGSRVIEYGTKENPIFVVDQDERQINLTKLNSSEFYLDEEPDIENIKFVIPEVIMEKKAIVDIKMDLPDNGKDYLNEPVYIDEFTVDIESIHHDSINSISMDVNPHFNEESTSYLKYFTFHNKDETLLNSSSFSFITDPTDKFVIKYQGIEINPESSSVELITDSILMVKRGDWIYNITAKKKGLSKDKNGHPEPSTA